MATISLIHLRSVISCILLNNSIISLPRVCNGPEIVDRWLLAWTKKNLNYSTSCVAWRAASNRELFSYLWQKLMKWFILPRQTVNVLMCLENDFCYCHSWKYPQDWNNRFFFLWLFLSSFFFFIYIITIYFVVLFSCNYYTRLCHLSKILLCNNWWNFIDWLVFTNTPVNIGYFAWQIHFFLINLNTHWR